MGMQASFPAQRTSAHLPSDLFHIPCAIQGHRLSFSCRLLSLVSSSTSTKLIEEKGKRREREGKEKGKRDSLLLVKEEGVRLMLSVWELPEEVGMGRDDLGGVKEPKSIVLRHFCFLRYACHVFSLKP